MFFWLIRLGLCLVCTVSSFFGGANETKAETPPQSIVASYYGQIHHGNATASCPATKMECQNRREYVFDMNGDTVAHRFLPFGSIVELTYPATKRTTHGRICDRGPFKDGRDLDPSEAIASMLGYTDRGVVTLTMRVIYQPRTAEEVSSGRRSCADQSRKPRLNPRVSS